MSLQKQFLNFNSTISLDYDKRTDLKDKRDGLIKTLQETKELPSFYEFNQGSYAMHTAVNPITTETKKQEYDLDAALIFNANKDDVDPMDYKHVIYDRINNRTDYGAEIKKPCVTLTYKKNSERGFHVDLVVYTYENKDNREGQLYIAKGKSASDPNKCWEKADPKGLVEYINTKIQNTEEREQCRRIVRYLKRWKALKFGKDHAEPASIGITLFAFENFVYYEDDDLSALITMLNKLLNHFVICGYSVDGNPQYSITYSLPSHLRIASGNNLFEKMTIAQMTVFRNKVTMLIKDLNTVSNEPDLIEQCTKLKHIFGEDFIIPEKSETSKIQKNYIPLSSSSGS